MVSKDELLETLRQIMDQGSHSMPDEDEPKKVLGKVVPRVCTECRASARTLTSRHSSACCTESLVTPNDEGHAKGKGCGCPV